MSREDTEAELALAEEGERISDDRLRLRDMFIVS